MSDSVTDPPRQTRKRKSGVPTGNAGEYLVMGELLRRGFDAQLADRNTKGYDILVGVEGYDLKRVQVKTVRVQPWYVTRAMFEGVFSNQVTVYVLLGREDSQKAVRFFITRNRDLEKYAHYPANWRKNGFMKLSAVEQYERRWDWLAAYCSSN